MAKRKLVEIQLDAHRRIEALRARCRKAKGYTPSVPLLVNLALTRGLPEVLATFEPKED